MGQQASLSKHTLQIEELLFSTWVGKNYAVIDKTGMYYRKQNKFSCPDPAEVTLSEQQDGDILQFWLQSPFSHLLYMVRTIP